MEELKVENQNNENFRACVIKEKTYWYSKDRRFNADIRKLCSEIYNQDPAVVADATSRIWRSIKRNPSKMPAPLTLESLSLALHLHCDLDNPEDRHAFFALLQHHEVVRNAFYHFVFHKNAADLIQDRDILRNASDSFFDHISARFPKFFVEQKKVEQRSEEIQKLYEDNELDRESAVVRLSDEQSMVPHEGQDVTTSDTDDDKGKGPAEANADHPVDQPAMQPVEAPPAQNLDVTEEMKAVAFKLEPELPDFEEFSNQFNDQYAAVMKQPVPSENAGLALGLRAFPLHYELLEEVWNSPQGFRAKFVDKFTRDAKFVKQLFQEAPAIVDMIKADRLIEKAKTQPGIIIGATAKQPVDNRLLEQIEEVRAKAPSERDGLVLQVKVVKELLGQDWRVYGSVVPVNLKLGKPLKAADGERLSQPQDIIAGYDRLPDPRKIAPLDPKFEIEFMDLVNSRRAIALKLTTFITQLNQAITRGGANAEELVAFRKRISALRTELNLGVESQDEEPAAGLVEVNADEDNSFSGLLRNEIVRLGGFIQAGGADQNELRTIKTKLDAVYKKLISEDDAVSNLYIAPICDFFVDAINYFSFGNADAVDNILMTISAGHLVDPVDQELRYRLYHPYTINKMTEYWLAHFDKFVIAAGPHQEYLAHLLTHVKDPIRFIAQLAKQDNLAEHGRQQYIADHIAKIMPVLSAIPGRQAKRARNRFLREMRQHIDVPATFKEKLRRQTSELIAQFAQSGGVDKDDQILGLLDDDKLRGKLKLTPNEVLQLLTRGQQEGVQRHDPRFELIIAKDANLWLQYQIASPNFDLLPAEFPYLTARHALDQIPAGGLMSYVENEYGKLQQHFDKKNKVDASYTDERKLNSYQALLIVSSKNMWKQVDPYQRFPVRAFLNRIPGLGLFNSFFNNESKKLVALNPLFRWKLEHDDAVEKSNQAPKNFADYVLRTPGTMEVVWSYDSDRPVANAEDEPVVDISNLIIPQVKAEIGAIIPDIARGTDLITAYKVAQEAYKKPDNYHVNSAMVGNLREHQETPVKVVLGRQYHRHQNPNQLQPEHLGQNALHASLATTPKRRDQFIKQINTPEKMRVTRELLFQTPVMREVSVSTIIEFLKSKEFGERTSNPLYYGRDILVRFPEKFVELLFSTDPAICAELPAVIDALGAVIQLIFSSPHEDQILTPNVLLAFLKIGGSLSNDTLEKKYHMNRREFEASLTRVFIANPDLAKRLLDVNFTTVAEVAEMRSIDDNFKADKEEMIAGQAKCCLANIMLAIRADLTAENLIELMKTNPQAFEELFMRDELVIGDNDEGIRQVLIGMAFEDFQRVIECVFTKDPVSGFVWMQQRYAHHRDDREVMELLSMPNIGLHYLAFEKPLDDWGNNQRDVSAIKEMRQEIAVIQQKISTENTYHYLLSCRDNNSLWAQQCLKTAFNREPARFYALLRRLSVEQISELAEFNDTILDFEHHQDADQHPLLKYLVNKETICEPEVFVNCLRSNFPALHRLLIDVLKQKREAENRYQLLIQVLAHEACDQSVLELLLLAEPVNVILQALEEPEFVNHYLANDLRTFAKLLGGPQVLKTRLIDGLTNEILGTLFFNAAGRAYNAGEKADAILQFVLLHKDKATDFIGRVNENADACKNITDEAYVLMFNLADYDEGMFRALCLSPHMLPRLLELRERGVIELDLVRHIKPLLSLIANNERLFQHCSGNNDLQDDFNKVIAQLMHSTVLEDRILLRNLYLADDSRIKLKLIEKVSIQQLTSLLDYWGDYDRVALAQRFREESSAANQYFLMEEGMRPENFKRNWPEYLKNPDVLKTACRYRGDFATWFTLLTHEWQNKDGVTQSAIVDLMIQSQKNLDLRSFMKDLAESTGDVILLFKANPHFALAILSDVQLHRLSEFSYENLYQLIQDDPGKSFAKFLFSANKNSYATQWLRNAVRTAPAEIKHLFAGFEVAPELQVEEMGEVHVAAFPEYIPPNNILRDMVPLQMKEFDEKLAEAQKKQDWAKFYQSVCEISARFQNNHPKFLHKAIELAVTHNYFDGLTNHVKQFLGLPNYHPSVAHLPVDWLGVRQVRVAVRERIATNIDGMNSYLIELCDSHIPEEVAGTVADLVLLGVQTITHRYLDQKEMFGAAANPVNMLQLLSAATTVVPEGVFVLLGDNTKVRDTLKTSLLTYDTHLISLNAAIGIARLQILLLRSYLTQMPQYLDQVRDVLWQMQSITPEVSRQLMPVTSLQRRPFQLQEKEIALLIEQPLFANVLRCPPLVEHLKGNDFAKKNSPAPARTRQLGFFNPGDVRNSNHPVASAVSPTTPGTKLVTATMKRRPAIDGSPASPNQTFDYSSDGDHPPPDDSPSNSNH